MERPIRKSPLKETKSNLQSQRSVRRVISKEIPKLNVGFEVEGRHIFIEDSDVEVEFRQRSSYLGKWVDKCKLGCLLLWGKKFLKSPRGIGSPVSNLSTRTIGSGKSENRET